MSIAMQSEAEVHEIPSSPPKDANGGWWSTSTGADQPAGAAPAEPAQTTPASRQTTRNDLMTRHRTYALTEARSRQASEQRRPREDATPAATPLVPLARRSV